MAMMNEAIRLVPEDGVEQHLCPPTAANQNSFTPSSFFGATLNTTYERALTHRSPWNFSAILFETSVLNFQQEVILDISGRKLELKLCLSPSRTSGVEVFKCKDPQLENKWSVDSCLNLTRNSSLGFSLLSWWKVQLHPEEEESSKLQSSFHLWPPQPKERNSV